LLGKLITVIKLIFSGLIYACHPELAKDLLTTEKTVLG
jgi:hypothetical protein